MIELSNHFQVRLYTHRLGSTEARQETGWIAGLTKEIG